MDTKLYIGNLSYNTTEADLRAMFSEAGTVQQIDMIMDRDTGRPKGFAFITMGSQAEAEAAIRMFNQKRVDERELTVNIARPREERSGPGRYQSGPSRGGRGGSNRRY
jgi:RNA recognition motif-containing protein